MILFVSSKDGIVGVMRIRFFLILWALSEAHDVPEGLRELLFVVVLSVALFCLLRVVLGCVYQEDEKPIP